MTALITRARALAEKAMKDGHTAKHLDETTSAISQLCDALELAMGALESLEFQLQMNASGEMKYGGFHTPLEEFRSIHSTALKALQKLRGAG